MEREGRETMEWNWKVELQSYDDDDDEWEEKREDQKRMRGMKKENERL